MLVDQYDNLIVAGRCVSVTHDADKFTRNMGPIGQTGQAAGTLAGLMALQKQSDPKQLIRVLQQRLVTEGLPIKKEIV